MLIDSKYNFKDIARGQSQSEGTNDWFNRLGWGISSSRSVRSRTASFSIQRRWFIMQINEKSNTASSSGHWEGILPSHAVGVKELFSKYIWLNTASTGTKRGTWECQWRGIWLPNRWLYFSIVAKVTSLADYLKTFRGLLSSPCWAFIIWWVYVSTHYIFIVIRVFFLHIWFMKVTSFWSSNVVLCSKYGRPLVPPDIEMKEVLS